MLSDRNGNAVITQDELAKLLGVARPTLRRCLADLETQGAIKTQYGKLRVIDASVLRVLTDEQ